MAERVRFELTVVLPTHAFQACALNHSAISPAAFNLIEFAAARNVFHVGTANRIRKRQLKLPSGFWFLFQQ